VDHARATEDARTVIADRAVEAHPELPAKAVRRVVTEAVDAAWDARSRTWSKDGLAALGLSFEDYAEREDGGDKLVVEDAPGDETRRSRLRAVVTTAGGR
jgi:hypothetical protein